MKLIYCMKLLFTNYVQTIKPVQYGTLRYVKKTCPLNGSLSE